MSRTKGAIDMEFSPQDLCNLIVAKHTDGNGYRGISKTS